MLTTTTHFYDEDWHEVAVGANEYLVDATVFGRYAYGVRGIGGKPEKTVLGHPLQANEPLTAHLPDGFSLWFRAFDLPEDGDYRVNVTPATPVG